MEIIGKGANGNYLCSVSHTELEKYTNQYYGKMGKLEIGNIVDLGKGYDFYHQTKVTLEKTEDFIKQNKKTIETILTGISLFSSVTNGEDK